MNGKRYGHAILLSGLIALSACGTLADVPSPVLEETIAEYIEQSARADSPSEAESQPLSSNEQEDVSIAQIPVETENRLSWEHDVTQWEETDDWKIPVTGECSVQTALHEAGNVLTFCFAYSIQGDVQFSASQYYAEYDIALTIETADGDFIQQIDYTYYGESPLHGNIVQALADDNCFTDINFDGYLDLRLYYENLGVVMYPYYYGWVWNPDTGCFDETNYHEITDPTPFVRNNRKGIYSWYRNSGDSWTAMIYQYRDGTFVQTNRLEKYGGFGQASNYWIDDEYGPIPFKEYHLVDGEMVLVWPEDYCSEKQGQTEIQEYLFGKDSIWFAYDE